MSHKLELTFSWQSPPYTMQSHIFRVRNKDPLLRVSNVDFIPSRNYRVRNRGSHQSDSFRVRNSGSLRSESFRVRNNGSLRSQSFTVISMGLLPYECFTVRNCQPLQSHNFRVRNRDTLQSETFSVGSRGLLKKQSFRVRNSSGDLQVPVQRLGWEAIGEALSTAFPLWVTLACVLALYKPPAFLWMHSNLKVFGISVTMLGMGMTLTIKDLHAALAMPKELLAGFVLQYTIMPLSGAFVSKLLRLPTHYAAGLILVACCPGGTASNIVTYLARANVALSVLMTAASTISAVVMTPFLTAKLAGQLVAVDAAGLFISTVQVVLAPVLVGALMNQYCHGVVKFVSPFMPLTSVLTVALLCGSAIAQNASAILMSGQQVVLAACALHGSGFFFGYALSRILGLDVSSSRTISIEVGMQNSVLGVVLAGQHFSNPLTAVPCAVSSVCHSIYGSILAGIWRYTTPPTKDNC
ncbi:hypothetical protein AMTRI_Chr02g213540 [Amborella trichopoda]